MKNLTIIVRPQEDKPGYFEVSSKQMKCQMIADKKNLARLIMNLQSEWADICEANAE